MWVMGAITVDQFLQIVFAEERIKELRRIKCFGRMTPFFDSGMVVHALELSSRKLRQEDHNKVEASLSYLAKPRLEKPDRNRITL